MNENTTEYAVLRDTITEHVETIKRLIAEKATTEDELKETKSLLHYYGTFQTWKWYDFIKEGFVYLGRDLQKAYKILFKKQGKSESN